jgi:phage shock protein A
MDSAETMARFEHLESRIERMEAEAEMAGFSGPKSIDEEFDDLAVDEEIEKELAKMKAAAYGDEQE